MIKNIRKNILIKFCVILVLISSSLILSIIFALSKELSELFITLKNCAINGDSLFFKFIPNINLLALLPYEHKFLQFSLANLFDLLLILNLIAVSEKLFYHYFIKKNFIDYCENLFLLDNQLNTNEDEFEGFQLKFTGRISRSVLDNEKLITNYEHINLNDYIYGIVHRIPIIIILKTSIKPYHRKSINLFLDTIFDHYSPFKNSNDCMLKTKNYISFSIQYINVKRFIFGYPVYNFSISCFKIVYFNDLEEFLQIITNFITKIFNNMNLINQLNNSKKKIS